MLFEYDRRFIDRFGGEAVTFYDYNNPLALPEHLHNSFDYVRVVVKLEKGTQKYFK
jgi:hypothetical protein